MPLANDLARIGVHDAVRFVNSHRVLVYSLVSFVSVSAVITNALKNQSNFYSVSIYLSKSSRSVLVLANFGVLLTLLCGHIVQRIFFGALRPNEVERLYERLWFFITESLLAFTIFRDEFDTPFALMFGFLLFVKSFHWLASDRIEWMDQRPYPGPPLLFHLRMNILFVILWATDLIMFVFAVEHTVSVGVGGMVLFASEYGILMASALNTMLKYLLSTYDLRRAGRRGGENAPSWENKSMWTFYIELTTDFLKLTTYLIFFVVIISWYGLPLNIARDVYITARSFITRLRALHRYQTATRNMDQRYPDATDEELTATSDRTCIICREEMVLPGAQEVPQQQDGPNTTPKKLPCGHIFHFYCLRSWLERQQSCPTCRRSVLDDTNAQTPAAPQPGQRPEVPGDAQRGNPLAPQAGNGQIPQGGNGPLGLLGRFFGPPARLANPAQPNQVRLPNYNNLRAQGGGQPPGIFINYQVQYQLARPLNEPEPEPVRRTPVPPYRGFEGPSGRRQPWQADDETTTEQNTVESPIDHTSSNNASATLENDTGPEHPTPLPHGSQGPSSDLDAQAGIQNPRAAAALAALRRSGGPYSSDIRLSNTSINTTDAVKTPISTSSEQPRSPPSTAPIVDNILPGSSTLSGTTPSTNHTQTDVAVPRLIPILEFGPGGPISRPRPSRETSWLHNRSHRSLRDLTSDLGMHTPSPRVPQRSDSLTSIASQLPSSLTEEQLSTLDILTRESIDERLRVLEGVSGSVYRCIDDLIRLRSALPPVDAAAATISESPRLPPMVPARQTEGSTSNEKGKERDTEASPTGGLPDDQSSDSSTEQLVDI